MKTGKEPVTTIIVIIILLAAAGVFIYWNVFTAYPATKEAVVCDVLGRLTGGCPSITASVGNLGNPVSSICFTVRPTHNWNYCIRKETGGLALRVGDVLNVQGVGADPVLTPTAAYLTFGDTLCKYSYIGKEWCKQLEKKHTIWTVSADDNFVCASIQKIGENKFKLMCANSKDGKIILNAKDLPTLPGKLILFNKQVYVLVGDAMYSFDLSQIKGKKDINLNKFSLISRDVRSGPVASDDTLCYVSRATTPTGTALTCTNTAGQTYSRATTAVAQVFSVLDDDILAGQVDLDTLYVIKKSSAFKNDPAAVVPNFDITGATKYSIQDSRYICYGKFSTNTEYWCTDKLDFGNKMRISVRNGRTNPSFIDNGILYFNYGQQVCAIDIKPLVDANQDISLPSTDHVEWCRDLAGFVGDAAGKEFGSLIGLHSTEERLTSAPLIAGGEVSEEATPEEEEDGPRLPVPG